MRRLLQAAVVLVAVAVLVLASLPPARADLSPRAEDGTVTGTLHVHTDRSDGRSGPEVIAAAAKRAGLGFVIFTDHGDGTRAPDAAVYRDGVLCIDGVEISTNGGHYLALGMAPSPYPLGGEPRDVVEDVRRLGGFGVAAHPDSPKAELRWRDWDLPVDAIEIVNPDTAWRLLAQSPTWRPKLRLIEALLTYPFRPAETIANLVDDVSETTAHWDLALATRQVVGLAGADAHAVVGWKDADPRGPGSLPLPSYESSFRSLTTHVRTDRALTGEPVADAAAIVDALRQGQVYFAVDGLATPPSFEFTAENRDGTAGPGGRLNEGGPTTLRVRSNAPGDFTTSILAGQQVIASARGPSVTVETPGAPGAYRVEIRNSQPARRLWLASNPIYLGPPVSPLPPPNHPPARQTRALYDGATAAGWRIESDPMSQGSIDPPPGDGTLRFAFHLAATHAQAAVALVADVPESVAPHDRVSITARADRPMRLSLQFRAAAAGGGESRWTRSLFLDTTEREHTIDFDDVRSIGTANGTSLPVNDVRHILLVADRSNTKPGAEGTVWIRRAALEK